MINKRVQQSKNLLEEALLTLMKKNNFKDITISNICDLAYVSRNTFYRIFETKEDMLKCIIKEKIGYIVSQFELHESPYMEGPFKEDLERRYRRFFTYWEDNREFLCIIKKQNMFVLFNDILSEQLVNSISEYVINRTYLGKNNYLREYYYKWLGAAMGALIETWVNRNFEEDVEQIVQLTISLYKTVDYQL